MIVSYNGGMQEEDIQAKSHEEIIAELNGVQRRQLLDLVLLPKRFVEYKNTPEGLEVNDIEMSNHEDQEDTQSDAPVTPPQVKNLKDEEMATPPTVQMRTPSPKLILNRKGGKGKYEAVAPDSPGGCLGSSEDNHFVEEEEEEDEERLPNVPSLRSKQEKQSDFVKTLSPTIVSTLQPRPQTAKVGGNNLELEPGMAAALAHPLSDLVQTPATMNDTDNSDDNDTMNDTDNSDDHDNDGTWDEAANMCAICLDDYGKYFCSQYHNIYLRE